MKRRNYIKFTLDVEMALLFVLFFNKRVLGGQSFHEIAGLVFAVMYFTHILLNWKWVIGVTRMLFDRKLPWKTRGNYALNLLLLISMTFVIISGVLISKVVFPNIHVANQEWFHITHISVSYFVLLLIGIHVGVHWQWVLNVWRKIWRYSANNAWGGYAARTLTIFVLLFGMYEIYNTGFIKQLSGLASVFGVNTENMQGHGARPDFHNPKNGMGTGGGVPMNAVNSTQSSSQNFHANQTIPQGFGDGMGHNADGQVNFLGVIGTYSGILAVFAILTFYLKKLTERAKKKIDDHIATN